jgi:isocitrate dehydrogenase
VRPVTYFDGVPSPMKHPENVDVVIFRENTEDVYAGIEYQSGTPRTSSWPSSCARRWARFFRGRRLGIKPISPFASKRLVRKAIQYAIDNGREASPWCTRATS